MVLLGNSSVAGKEPQISVGASNKVDTMSSGYEPASDNDYGNNFTLLIAGPDHECVQKMVGLNGGLAANVIVSRWENGKNPIVLPSAQVVTSSLLGVEQLNRLHNSQNIYLQVTTVLAGLEKVDTPYVIKTRSDEFFSNLSLMVAAFNPTKLLCANVFVRDVSYKPYHISDHLFIGRTDRIKSAFRALKQYIETDVDRYGILNSQTPAELKVAIFYLQACGYEIERLIGSSEEAAFEVMKKEFDVFDVDTLQPFEISSSVAGKITAYRKYVRHDSVLGLRHITSINQMAPQGKSSLLFQRALFKLRRLLGRARFFVK